MSDDRSDDYEYDAREYQVELLAKAIEQNTIVCLKTGSGKTFIAVMMIKELEHQIRIPYKEGGKRSMFLVPKVPLVYQQADAIEKHSSLKVGRYCGACGVDLWDKDRWEKELIDNQVLIMTAQILLNMLSNNFISMDRINLLILDECHTATGNAPYVEIMSRYPKLPDCSRPRILGLTASIFNKKCKPHQVESVMTNLETVLSSRIETASNENMVNRYSTKPFEMIVECGKNSKLDFDDVETTVLTMLENTQLLIREIMESSGLKTHDDEIDFSFIPSDQLENVIQEFLKDNDTLEVITTGTSPETMLKNVKGVTDCLGLWCTVRIIEKFLEEIPVLMERAEEELKLHKVKAFEVLQDSLIEVKKYVEKFFEQYLGNFTVIRNESNDQLILMRIFAKAKVIRLLELFEDLKPENDRAKPETAAAERKFRGIIFVEQRAVAWILCEYLREMARLCKETYGYLSVDYVVGHGVNVAYLKQSSMNLQKQDKALAAFRDGSSNFLIATKLVEEGLDIPECNVVIRFDAPKSFCSYVQSKGRARAQKALYLIFADSDMNEIMDDLILYKKIECLLQLKAHDRNKVVDDEVLEFFDEYHLVEPYYPNGLLDGACVAMNSAVGTLNRFCCSVPRDRYTVYKPSYTSIKIDDSNYIGVIKLPFRCALTQGVRGQTMPNKKLAKKAAELETCKQLHLLGELDDDLNPAANYAQRLKEKLGIVLMDPVIPGHPIPGTKRCREIYEKEVSMELQNYPKSGQMVLHAIRFQRINKETSELVDSCKRKTSEECHFGILTSRRISKVSPFTVFGKNKFLATLEPAWHDIGPDHLPKLEKFHQYLFSTVLRVAPPCMVLTPDNAKMSFLVVPLKQKCFMGMEYDVDWQCVERCLVEEDDCNTKREPVIPKEDFIVTPDKYGDANMRRRRYRVQKVCVNMSPKSRIEDVNLTFSQYFRAHYGKTIVHLNQPLLLVDALSINLNQLKPVTRCEDTKAREIYLVPELCSEIPLYFEAYEQAFCLPSVIYRLNGLLLAKDLRREMVMEIGIEAPDDEAWLEPRSTPLESLCNKCRVSDDVIFHGEQFPVSDAGKAEMMDAVLYQALTTKSASNWTDLERLEVIGDSFLKLAVSISVFCGFSVLNEGALTLLRTGLVKNYNLSEHAKKKRIPSLLNATLFQPRSMWLPPGYVICENLLSVLVISEIPAYLWPYALNGDEIYDKESLLKQLLNRRNEFGASGETFQRNSEQISLFLTSMDDDSDSSEAMNFDHFSSHYIGDKTIADSVEAIIGAVLLCGGQDAALRLINWFGLSIFAEETELGHTPVKKSNFFPWKYPTSALIGEFEPDILNKIYVEFVELEASLGYTFKEKSFLRQALVHPSYTRSRVTDNYQKLEFIGDAVLDYLITMHLYKVKPNLTPGDLTDLRSALVDNVTFSYLSAKCKFHTYLRYSSQALFQTVNNYLQWHQNLKHPKDAVYLMAEDEVVALDEVEVPKALGDVFESIAGAIFLDSGLSLAAVWNVYYPIMKDVIEQYAVNLPINPIRVLMETIGPGVKFSKPKKHNGIYTVEVKCGDKVYSGKCKKKVFAKQAAAKCALRALKIDPVRHLKDDAAMEWE